MCELMQRKKSVCHGSTGKWLNPVKQSRWELPPPSSKSYWDGVCGEIENKYKRVRPILSSSDPFVPSILKPQISDDIRFKISPPIPTHESRTVTFRGVQSPSSTTEKAQTFDPKPNNIKLPLANFKNQKFSLSTTATTAAAAAIATTEVDSQAYDNITIYTKLTCPRHKAANAKTIPDDEIPRFLQAKSSVPTLPVVQAEKKILCEHRKVARSKSASASLTRLKSKQFNEQELKKSSQAPKLGAANVLPSFAKAASVDSSTGGARESFDVELESNVAGSRFKIDSTPRLKKDFMRVPNLKFVSSHPSFHKLSNVSSSDDNESDSQDASSVTSVEKIVIPERIHTQEKERIVEITDKSSTEEVDGRGLTSDAMKTKMDETSAKVKKKISKDEFEKKFYHKALDIVTKCKFSKVFNQMDSSAKSPATAGDNGEKLKKSDSIDIKFRRMKLDESPLDFKEISRKLKENARGGTGLGQSMQWATDPKEKREPVTIYTSSRSISGPSSGFDNKPMTPSEILQKIPQTKVFNRAHVDKCHACLHKPFEAGAKIVRELPLATVKSAVEDAPSKADASSSRSSSIQGDAQDIDIDVNLPDEEVKEVSFDHLKLNLRLSNFGRGKKIKEVKSKEQLKVSFDLSPSPTPKDDCDVEQETSPSEQQPHQQLLKSPADRLQIDKSLSVQSVDRSKSSTPSNHSSESDDDRLQDDNAPPPKYTAPCHAPIVLSPSFEPLRALRQKKATSLKARAAALTAVSSEGSDDDNEDEDEGLKAIIPKTQPTAESRSADEEEPMELIDEKVEAELEQKKPLVRTKTLTEISTSAGETEDDNEGRKVKLLKRSKTTSDMLTIKLDSQDDESKKALAVVRIGSKAVARVKEEKTDSFPLSELILAHRAGSPPPPIINDQEVLAIVKKCLHRDCNPPKLLNMLVAEFMRKFEEKCRKLKSAEDEKYMKIGLRLFKTLVDSRRYLKSNLFCPNLEFSKKQHPTPTSHRLRKILPPDSYDLIAPILGMPRIAGRKLETRSNDEEEEEDDFLENQSVSTGITFDLIVHPPTVQSTKKGRLSRDGYPSNPYALFLKKPRRKAIVWRPLLASDLKGYDPEATLEMRAARTMDRICKEFCNWLKELGESRPTIDEDTLKDMFEITFSAMACKATQFIVKELPTVPKPIVKIRHSPLADKLLATHLQVLLDLQSEKLPRLTHAFGRAVPVEQRFVPPRGGVSLSKRWLESQNVPRDLESMSVVWDGIMHLDSVKSFVAYLNEYEPGTSRKLLTELISRQRGNGEQDNSSSFDG